MTIYDFRGRWKFLSNFAWGPCTLDGVQYNTVEQAYQAAKSDDLVHRQRCWATPPAGAKQIGKKVRLRQDWENVKLDVMYNLVWQKFEHPMNRKWLLATADEELVEGNWWGDTFWGVCNGVGENHLGRILMRVRQEIREGK